MYVFEDQHMCYIHNSVNITYGCLNNSESKYKLNLTSKQVARESNSWLERSSIYLLHAFALP